MFYHSEKLQSTKTGRLNYFHIKGFIIAKNYRVLKRVIRVMAKKYRFIIAKNYRVLKPMV